MAMMVLGTVWGRVWVRGADLGSVGWVGARVDSGRVWEIMEKQSRGEQGRVRDREWGRVLGFR